MGNSRSRGHKKKSPKRSPKDRRINGKRRKPTVEELIAEEVIPPLKVDAVEAAETNKGRVVSGDQGKLLTDPHRVRGDLQLLRKATNKRWNVWKKNKLRRRLERIASQDTAEVVTKQGVVELHSKADELAINAIKVLVAMNQSDLELDKAENKQPSAPSVVIQNNVNSTDRALEQRRIELARLAQRFGARTLLIDGRQVPCTDILGTATEVPATKDAGQSEPSSAPPPASP